MKYFPDKNDGMFEEDDFRWIRDWGFDWVRLPMDYRFWTDSQDLLKIREDKVAPIDRAIQLGEKYGIHINLGLHRAPAYCILDTMDEALTGIHVTKRRAVSSPIRKCSTRSSTSGPISPAATKEYPAKNSASTW